MTLPATPRDPPATPLWTFVPMMLTGKKDLGPWGPNPFLFFSPFFWSLPFVKVSTPHGEPVSRVVRDWAALQPAHGRAGSNPAWFSLHPHFLLLVIFYFHGEFHNLPLTNDSESAVIERIHVISAVTKRSKNPARLSAKLSLLHIFGVRYLFWQEQ